MVSCGVPFCHGITSMLTGYRMSNSIGIEACSFRDLTSPLIMCDLNGYSHLNGPPWVS